MRRFTFSALLSSHGRMTDRTRSRSTQFAFSVSSVSVNRGIKANKISREGHFSARSIGLCTTPVFTMTEMGCDCQGTLKVSHLSENTQTS